MFRNSFMPNNDIHVRNTRSKYDLHSHRVTTSYGERCVQFKSIQWWNNAT